MGLEVPNRCCADVYDDDLSSVGRALSIPARCVLTEGHAGAHKAPSEAVGYWTDGKGLTIESLPRRSWDTPRTLTPQEFADTFLRPPRTKSVDRM